MRRRSLWSVAAAVVVVLAAVGWWAVAVRGPAGDETPFPAGRAAADQQAPVVPGKLPPLGVTLPASEASGLAASRHYPGVFYWLRDGGASGPDTPRDAIWGMRISAGGMPEPVRDGTMFPAYGVPGATNEDWEALTVDDEGALWIGQIGANNCTDEQRLIRVAEPDPTVDAPLEVVATYDLRFPDPKPGCRTSNAEAMIWLDGHFYLFAKTRGTPIYRVDLPGGAAGTAKLTRIGQIGHRVNNISAASISDDRQRLMVLDHRRVYVFTADATLRGDELIKDAVTDRYTGTAEFEAPGGATVEGGTFVPGTRDIAFVAEDGNIYYARPESYGEPPWTPPSPTAPPATWHDPALDDLPTLEPSANDVG